MSTAAEQARRHLRLDLKAGALQLSTSAPLIDAALVVLKAATDAGVQQACEHLGDILDTGTMPFAFLDMLGSAAFELRCPGCRQEPARALGCQVCGSMLGLKRVVAVVHPHGLVLSGQLCGRCRIGRL